jgi:hypothetical protein
LILASALLVAAPAAAQLPDLIGTWKGTGYAVRLGPSHYRTTKDVEAALLDKAVEFTYVIKQQHGHRLAGEMSSERGKRPFIGAMQQGNRGASSWTITGNISPDRSRRDRHLLQLPVSR